MFPGTLKIILLVSIFRGSRAGMWWQIGTAVLETRHGDADGASAGAYKGDRSRGGPYRGVGGIDNTA
jgi:hypothetical protein